MNYENMAISVSQLNNYIKEKFEKDEYLENILVKGEISNFKNHYTGHMYFTLKDENSLIKCIMFKGYAQRLDFMPKDGMKVFIVRKCFSLRKRWSISNLCESNARRWSWSAL